jgi:hypothetical protein
MHLLIGGKERYRFGNLLLQKARFVLEKLFYVIAARKSVK